MGLEAGGVVEVRRLAGIQAVVAERREVARDESVAVRRARVENLCAGTVSDPQVEPYAPAREGRRQFVARAVLYRHVHQERAVLQACIRYIQFRRSLKEGASLVYLLVESGRRGAGLEPEDIAEVANYLHHVGIGAEHAVFVEWRVRASLRPGDVDTAVRPDGKPCGIAAGVGVRHVAVLALRSLFLSRRVDAVFPFEIDTLFQELIPRGRAGFGVQCRGEKHMTGGTVAGPGHVGAEGCRVAQRPAHGRERGIQILAVDHPVRGADGVVAGERGGSESPVVDDLVAGGATAAFSGDVRFQCRVEAIVTIGVKIRPGVMGMGTPHGRMALEADILDQPGQFGEQVRFLVERGKKIGITQ